MASFLLLSKGTRRMSHTRRLFPYGPFPGHGGWGSNVPDPARGMGTTEGTNTARSKAMGNMTEKLKEGIKDTAGAVKRGAEKVKDAAVRGVDKSKNAAVRTAEKV